MMRRNAQKGSSMGRECDEDQVGDFHFKFSLFLNDSGRFQKN